MRRRVVIYGSDSGLRVWGAALSAIPDADITMVRHPDGGGRIPRISLRALLQARRAASRADVVIALSTLLGAGIALVSRSPVIAIDVGGARHAAVHGPVARLVVSILLGLPDIIIGLTDAHAASLRRLTPGHNRVRTVPQPAAPSNVRWRPDELSPYVLSAGASGRDLQTLCAAAVGLPFDIRLIEGGQELVPAPGTSVGSRYPVNVIRYGRVSRATYDGLLAGASAVVLPLPESDYPVGVTVMLDAMAAGVPVVAAAVPSVSFYQGQATAMMVPPEDAAALHRALRIIASDRDQASAISLKAVAHVRVTASPELVATTLRRLVDELT